MEVIANSRELLQFFVQSEIYSEAVLFKSLYWLTSRARFEVSKPRAGIFLVSVRPLGETFPVDESDDILAKVRTNLVDFKVRDIVNRETAPVRSMIIAKAFAHTDLPEVSQEQPEPPRARTRESRPMTGKPVSRKFLREPDFGTQQGKGYFLLPFRFHAIDNTREVLVNETGDHLLVPRGIAGRIARREVSESEALYGDLTANFFISRTPVPELLDVLSTRYITKKAFLESGTSLHIFVITLRCNHSCHYCQVSRVTQNQGQYDISTQDLKAGIIHMLASPSDEITMEFQGGEPLLAFDKVRYAVETTLELNRTSRKRISFVLCTNLTVLSDEILLFCQEHAILISTSLDGPEFVHNPNRAKSGAGSYGLVNEGINRAREALGHDRVSALMTTTALSLQYPSDIIETMNASVLREAAYSYKTGWGLTSLFSRLNLTYRDKYIAAVSMRRDGSSRFGSNNRYAYFPAASVAWRISEENFLREFKAISELKLRASYGRTGNQNIGNYVAQGTYSTGANYNGQSGVRIGGIPSADLSWESTDQADLGLDLGLFNQRLSLGVDLYKKVTNGLLFSMPLPQYTGFSSYWTNLGEIQNSGLELSINGDLVRKGNLSWSAGGNISFNKNKVNQLPNGTPILVTASTEVYYTVNATFSTQEGIPIGQFYGLQWTGEVYPTDEAAKAHVSSIMGQAPVGGALKYEDFNRDGKIDANDRQLIGSPHPKFFGGFNTQATWKNFDLNLQFSFVYGNMLFNQMRFLSSRGFAYDAARKERLNAWSEPGQITTEHKVLTATDARDNQFSSKYIEDASYLRLNNMSLGYNLPEKFTKSLNIQRLRIYLSAQNLFTLTDYTGYDPEVNAKAGDIRTQGVDIGMIPQVSTYMLGVNLNF